MDRARQLVDVLHQVVVLGAGARDAGGIGLLEGVIADQVRRHLPGQADDRDAVHQRIRQAGDRIGRARAGGDEHDADLAGRARVAFRRMHGALFVAHQDVAHAVGLEQRVIDRKHGAARIAEHELDALIRQGFDDHFGTGHLGLGHGTTFLPTRGTYPLWICPATRRSVLLWPAADGWPCSDTLLGLIRGLFRQ